MEIQWDRMILMRYDQQWGFKWGCIYWGWYRDISVHRYRFWFLIEISIWLVASGYGFHFQHRWSPMITNRHGSFMGSEFWWSRWRCFTQLSSVFSGKSPSSIGLMNNKWAIYTMAMLVITQRVEYESKKKLPPSLSWGGDGIHIILLLS